MKKLIVISIITLLLGAQGVCEPNAQELFQTNCKVCHGDQGRGDGPAATAMPTPPRDLTQRPYKFGCGPGAVASTIESGISESGMPPFKGKLSDDEIWRLAQYVRTLQNSCCSE